MATHRASASLAPDLALPTTEEPAPLRAVHTPNFPALLRQYGASLVVTTYQAGKLVEREYDTTGQHKIDTWDWFDPKAPVDGKTGRPAHPIRRERDVHGGGMIDQWWTWQGDKVTIATDRNGDGKPDPDSAITLGGDDDAGGAPAPPASTPTPASDGGSTQASLSAGADGGKR